MFSVPAPALLTETVSWVLPPVYWMPKSSGFGSASTSPTAPTPLRSMSRVSPSSMSESLPMTRVASKGSAAVGWKLMSSCTRSGTTPAASWQKPPTQVWPAPYSAQSPSPLQSASKG